MKIFCLVCEKELKSVLGGEEIENLSEPTDDSIYLYSRGNFGSTIFDEPNCYVLAHLCDECLKEKSDKIFVVEDSDKSFQTLERWRKTP